MRSIYRAPRNVPTARKTLATLLLLALGIAGAASAIHREARPDPIVTFYLTVLHSNDGESRLINVGQGLEDFGGVARFATVVQNLKAAAVTGPTSNVPEALRPRRGVILLSSGDNFLAGPQFGASLDHGVPYYDTIALDRIGYDAFAIGNHEFDFGPDVFADFLDGFTNLVPFVSANLDFHAEPRLQHLVDEGVLVGRSVVTKDQNRIGIVGATTPRLPYISSPRNVEVDPDVAAALQREIDALVEDGVNKIVMISHLQSIQEDLDLIPLLRHVDVMIAGGGSEVLANDGDLLVPGDEAEIYGPYPLQAQDANGRNILIVTTGGDYRYVGQLVVGFDKRGEIVVVNSEKSGPVRVAGGNNPDAVEPDPEVQALVVDPVSEYVDGLAQNVIGASEVPLDGRRAQVRTVETNEGNLVTDAIFWQAAELAGQFGVPAPTVGLQNGGGIRNNTTIPAGPISELNTYEVLPFANFVCIVPSVPAEQFKEILENAVSRVEFVDGRFAQISGFRMTWDPNGTAQVLDSEYNVVTPGNRVVEVVLDDDTVIVSGGMLEPGAPDITIATIDFLARGGDQYPYRDAPFTTLGVTYQQALSNYIVQGLGGQITAADYPEGGEGRISRASALRGETEVPALSGRAGLRLDVTSSFDRGGATIRFENPTGAPARVRLLDVTGRTIANLVDGASGSGRTTVTWDGRGDGGVPLPSGIYFIRLESGVDAVTRRYVNLR